MSDKANQVYSAIYKRLERLNAWEYNKQLPKSVRKLKPGTPITARFTPHYLSGDYIKAMSGLCNGNVTPEEAMAELHTVMA